MKGRLVVVSGPSGSGKTTICDLLERDYAVEYVVTATTRAPRPGERDGVDYRFFTRPEFERRLALGEFLEHAVVHGNLYGTPKSSVAACLERGAVCMLEIDTQGADQIRSIGEPHVSVFIDVPDLAVLEERLRRRRHEPGIDLAARLARARAEVGERDRYDHVVVNDDLDRAVAEVATHLKLRRRAEAAR
ncbi:MAG TPA: guanylate kinase [Planctomycetota bacterium]|nr:guanylate kinase [Planctomycetota bacterium]